MENTLMGVHFFVRYLVLTAAVAAAVVSLVVWLRRGASGPDRITMSTFTGLLDLQVLLGLILLTQRPFYGALMGHIMTMIIAAVVAHVGSVLAKRREAKQPVAMIRFVTVVAALALIAGGIAAIGRPIV